MPDSVFFVEYSYSQEDSFVADGRNYSKITPHARLVSASLYEINQNAEKLQASNLKREQISETKSIQTNQ